MKDHCSTCGMPRGDRGTKVVPDTLMAWSDAPRAIDPSVYVWTCENGHKNIVSDNREIDRALHKKD